jgi:predicted  nucleic acid-binding Zn-ribbon protein
MQPRHPRRGRPIQRTHAPPVRAAGPISFESRIRGMDTRIEWLAQAADHSHKVFERAKQLHDELAAKLRPLTKPAPALANELKVLARRLEEASAKRLDADAQLARAKQERDRLLAARAQAP